MTTSITPEHRLRHVASRCCAYAATFTFIAFLFYIITDFEHNAWPFFGFGAITLLIVANTISHTGSGNEGRNLLNSPDERA